MVPHPPHGRPTENGPAPLLTLKVLLGGTRFPIRPVLKDRFTIGSGERCDLRLGGDLPPLHSVLLVTPTEVLLEQIASSPALIVNRVAQSSAVLHDGDRIRIGGVELEASLPAPSAVRFPSPLSGQVRETVTAEEQAEVDLTALSAEQLLDLFELEQTEIERDALGRNQGAEALLSEARSRQKREQINTVHAPSPTTVGPHWNMARIPLERLIEAAARRASGEAALQQKIDTLQLAVARLGQQIDSIVATQSTSAARNSNAISDTVTQLRRERTRLITELNALFQDDAPLASRTTA